MPLLINSFSSRYHPKLLDHSTAYIAHSMQDRHNSEIMAFEFRTVKDATGRALPNGTSLNFNNGQWPLYVHVLCRYVRTSRTILISLIFLIITKLNSFVHSS